MTNLKYKPSVEEEEQVDGFIYAACSCGTHPYARECPTCFSVLMYKELRLTYRRGVEDAAKAVCGNCEDGVQLVTESDGYTHHRWDLNNGKVETSGCEAADEGILELLEPGDVS